MSNEAPQNTGSTRPNFPQMELDVAAFWQKHDIFKRSIEERPENKSFVFYDGPPFATGLPHYGHLLQSSIKDAVPRYKTMQGFRVERKWGWDCHGLPMEAYVQKELKLSTKKDIEEYGIGAFNEKCAASVLVNANIWRRYVERIGRWVDMDGAYKTMDTDFIESVWWAFAQLWQKQLIYKDLRVSLYSPSNGTPLSNFEVAMEDSYIDAEDPSLTLKFKVKGEEDTYFLAWTTTPWSLMGNVALAVHPEEIYIRVKLSETGETLIFAEKLMSKVLSQYFPLQGEMPEVPFEVLAKIKGSDLEGVEYEPPYPLAPEAFEALVARAGENLYRVIPMEYVSIEDGTGIVHTAPAFGEEDFLASKTHDLPVLVTLDEGGMQRAEVPLVGGQFYEKSNEPIMADLERRGLLYRRDTITHSVAIFARNKTRLIYKAQPAWYVNVAKIKSKMIDAAKKVNWHPGHLKEGRFGKGLATAPDWCISRSRFWGAPLPVWTNADGTDIRVFGSIDELEEVAKVKIERKHSLNMHRPAIDLITFTNERGEEMRRIPEVLDCWFESGSMPYASNHYPIENAQRFETNYPADFISEGQDQTRAWFFYLHTLSVALFGKPSYKDVMCTGLIQGSDGKKMSKSLKNYPDPEELINRVGADALRVYLLSSPVVAAESIDFSERDVETIQRTVFGTLWNVRAFYLTYAGTEKVEITKPRSTQILDRWLMARLAEVTKEMTASMDEYDLVAALRPLRGWVDDLSTWWLRRSRERLKSEDGYEKMDAMRTLREALLQTALLLAPFAPFFAERLYQDLEGSKMSVHLDRWPKADERIIDEQLLSDMQWVRAVATQAHEERAKAKMPVRQALGLLTVTLRDTAIAGRLSQRTELLGIVRDETNVEKISVLTGDTGTEEQTVALDTTLTPELKKKGMVRELARHVMNLRKELGLTPQDDIKLTVAVSDLGFRDTFEATVASVAKDVRATTAHVVEVLPEGLLAHASVEFDGNTVELGIEKA